MNTYSLVASLLLGALALDGYAVSDNRILLDNGWRFSLSADSRFSTPDYDDSSWQKISLPHDWSVLNDFRQEEPAGNDGGYLPTGKGFYRTTIDLPAHLAGKPCFLYFEGAYMDSKVFVNGHEIGGRPYGYSSFRCDAGPYLLPGKNVIAVSVDNSRQKNSRWYSGSGIYRHVWLEPHSPLYIEPWSLDITTPVVSDALGVARINFTLFDRSSAPATHDRKIPVAVSVSRQGSVVKSVTDSILLRKGETVKFCSYEVPVSRPSLWSPDSPSLYEASVAIHLPDGTSESETETFGFRSIGYSADKGFLLNGKNILINGACLHHDNGILGAASYDDAEIRKARLMKDAGFNAVRTSHNPPAPAFIAACDSIGLMVIDEAFDGWKSSKTPYDYSLLFDDWALEDVAALVKRDRNHPSIIAWSIGNEIIERKSPEAVSRARMLVEECRRLDPSRPVTSALAAWDPDWEIYDPLASAHDIVGYNYMIHKAETDHQRVPSRVMWQTESYPRDAFSNWAMVTDHPYVIGDFVWTGIDYIGESGIGRHYYEGDPEGEHWHRPLWPWHNSQCGDVDIIGERKPISHYRQLLYNDAPKIFMAVREPDGYKGKVKETMWGTYPTVESWNWAGHEGKPIQVEIVSNYPSVELLQDGKPIGRKVTDRSTEYKAVFEIPYSPGEITAVALDADGNAVEKTTLKTSGKPYAIRLRADRSEVPLSSQSLAYITAEIIDKNGNLVSDAALPIKFEVSGEADIIATGSADPKDSSGYFRNSRTTQGGKALGIVKLNGNTPAKGMVSVKVSGPGLKAATLPLSVK